MPGYLDITRRSGPGLGAVLICSVFISIYYAPWVVSHLNLPKQSKTAIVLVAIIPPYLVWTIAKQYSDELAKLIAEEKIAEAYVQIKNNQGASRFYVDYDSDLQQELNELDQKFHLEAVNILSSIVLVGLAAVFTVIEFGQFGKLVLFVLIAVVLFGIVVLLWPSYRRLDKILHHAVRVSENNENQ